MNKLKFTLILLLFCGFIKAQTDTNRVSPPTPDNTQDPNGNPPATPTPTVTNTQPTNTVTPTPKKEEPNRKRPKSYNDYVNKGKQPTDVKPFMEHVYYGCNLQLGYYGTSYGSALYYDISPHACYKFTDVLSGGVQVIYNNTTYTSGTQKMNYNIFGIGGFGRALVLNRLFLQVEYDLLSIPANYRNNAVVSRNVSDEKMAGIGYKSPLGDKLSYFFVLMYDFQPGPYSPYLYNPLVYRAGLSWNF
jgi:hypothetical protein